MDSQLLKQRFNMVEVFLSHTRYYVTSHCTHEIMRSKFI